MRLFDYRRLSDLMDKHGADILLASTRYSVGHLSGFVDEDIDEHHNMWYSDVSYAQICGVPRDEREPAFLVLPAINSTAVAAEDPWIKDRRFWGPGNYVRNWSSARPDGGRPTDDVVRALRERGMEAAHIAIEKRYLPVEYFEQLRSQLPNAEFVEARPILTKLRAIKTHEELRRIREACARSAKVFNTVRQALRGGLTVEELRWLWIQEFARLQMTWARGVIYFGPAGTSLAGGPPSVTRQPLKPGHAVRADIVGRYMGYVCDMSRVFTLGRVDAELERIHSQLQLVLQAMMAAVSPGVLCSDVRRVQLKMFAAMHRAPSVSFGGHSFGRTIHEWPYIEESEDTPLEAGMVITLEPSLTFSTSNGDFVASLEEDVVVTTSGSENLTGDASLALYI